MTAALLCPKCQTRIRVPEDHVGAKIACPNCEHLVALTDAAGPGAAEITEAPPAARRPARRTAEEVEPDEDALLARKRPFQPCPRCGAESPRRVMWTPWGSFYGPALFNHVRCRDCRYAYNGRTGGSNLIPAIVFVTIPLLLMAGIIGFIVWSVLRAM